MVFVGGWKSKDTRKYYRITEAGITALKKIKKEYQREREQLDHWLG